MPAMVFADGGALSARGCLAVSYLERAMPGHVSKAEAALIALGLAGAIE